MQMELSEFTAVIGIDWADKKHDVCVQAAGSTEREFSTISHRVDKIHEWGQLMVERHGGQMAVAIELSQGPIVSALDLLTNHPERFTPLNPQSVQMRTLITLVEQRRRLMNDKGRITNRLRNALKQYYPQALDWFDHIDTPLFCAFIKQWPTLAQVKRARRTTLEKFFHAHKLYRKDVIERRIHSIQSAMPLTRDEAIITPYRLQALVQIDHLEVVFASLARYDAEIAALAPQHPDYALFSGLPGAGPQLAPRLLVAFGEQRERFANAAEVQKYSGVAPVTERSGQKSWVHWRWQCPTFLRQTFVEWAAQTINKSYWANLYYYQQRAKGCSYQAAVRSLAFKWIRILYRCWVTRTPYDEAIYLKALRDRGSPLLATQNT